MLSLKTSNLSGSYNGLGRKILFARQVKQEATFHPEVRAFAEAAAGKGDRKTQAARIFNIVRDGVNYVPDPVGIEQTKAPWVMLEEIRERGYAAGDCDDQATLSYVLLNSIGIPAKLRVTWTGRPDPQHIYVIARLDSTWAAFDTTRSFMGQESPYTKVKDFA